ncbi:MAG: hypothetical protein K2Q20_04310 [Phycisphaerales bacterium]|nr:hypothetical protein [Phycisphaerales bacterium]
MLSRRRPCAFGRGLLCSVWLAALGALSPAQGQTVTPAGSGSYYTGVPAGQELPQNSDGAAVLPRVDPSFTGPAPTNKWWSSLIWQRYAGNPYSQPMHAQPLSLQTNGTGLDIGQPAVANNLPADYYYELTRSVLRNLATKISRVFVWY